MKLAGVSVSKINFAGSGNLTYNTFFLFAWCFRQTVIHGVTTASYKVKLKSENVVGVHLPVFDSINERNGQPSKSDHFNISSHFLLFFLFHDWLVADLTGLGRGGQQVNDCRKLYVTALGGIVKLASLQV
jgi:V-type H+-transporting ATPase subunit D